MKKTLVVTLALVFVLGLAGTAFANPYSDVPAGHWAYKAVMDLTKAGVVEGYGGKFQGNQTMTRYEMAAITARAMAKANKAGAGDKATIDKLAVEFSKELNDLGVKVAKLEKQLGTWTFKGDARIRYQVNADLKASDANSVDSTKRFQERVRFYGQSNLNEDTVVNFRLAQQNSWAKKTNDGTAQYENNKLEMDIAKFTFKNAIGSADFVFGRDALYFGATGLMADSGGVDGARFQDNSKDFKWQIGSYAGNGTYLAGTGASPVTGKNADDTKAFWYAQGSYPVLDNTVLTAGYIKGISNVYLFDNYYVGAKATVGDFTLAGDYTKNNEDKAPGNTKGLYGSVWYKGANPAKVGTWGVYVDYRKVGESAIDGGLSTLNAMHNGSYATTTDYSKLDAKGQPTVTTKETAGTGVKGLGYGFNYTFVKNGKFTLCVEDLDSYNGNVKYDTMVYARAEFYF